MKPDLTYIRRLLDAFRTIDKPHVDIEDLAQLGWDYRTPEFFFHLRLLADEGLVEGAAQDKDLGFKMAVDGKIYWSVAPLRLTAAGHEFASALKEQSVVEKIKSTLSDAGLSVWVNVAAPLAIEAAKQKLGLSSS